MSSRIEQQRQEQARQAEKAQKTQDRADRDQQRADSKRETFASKIKQQGAEKQQTEKQTKEHLAGQRQGEQAQKNQGQNSANRMGRGGSLHEQRLMQQAKSFSGVLGQHQQKTQEDGKVQNQARNEGLNEDSSLVSDRKTDLDHQTEDVKDSEEAQRTEEAHQEAQTSEARESAIESATDAPRKDQQGHQGGGEEGSPQAQAVAAQEGPQGAAGAHPIPPELLEKLVAQVFVGYNPEGEQLFNFTFSEGVLDGCSVEISSDGSGKINMTISGLDGNTKRLLQACEGDIAKRLSAKKLQLEDFEVV